MSSRLEHMGNRVVLRTRLLTAAVSTTLLIAAPGAAQAATYYVGNSGNDANTCAQAQTASTPRKTIQSAIGCLSAGSTLVIQSGTYTGTGNAIANLPSGTAGNYVTIKADVDGGVIVTSGISMSHTNTYVQIEGLRFENAEQKNIVGNHIKFMRCEFKGGPATGNSMNTTIGTNDFADTADILIEDSWFHGGGGRYNLLVYNSDRVIVRRVVIRHDGGWTDGGSQDPESGLNFYDSADSHAQNVVVLDSNLNTYSTWSSPFYNVKNDSVPHPNTGNTWTGIIALNNAQLGFRTDATSGSQTFTDVILWDNWNGGMDWCCGMDNVTSIVNRATIGRTKITASGDFQAGFGNFAAGSKTITNVIMFNLSGPDLNGVSATYFDTFGNGSTSSGTGRQIYDPRANGLRYLPRIEATGGLSTAGSGGGQMGARVVNRIGADGALKNDANWNADTGVSLWPWPNEARILNEMCTVTGVSRGFCSDSSLTNYIWNYLGNGNPNTGNAPSPPTNVRIVP
jgi:hypothetical protein